MKRQIFGSVPEDIAQEITEEAELQCRSLNNFVGFLIIKAWEATRAARKERIAASGQEAQERLSNKEEVA